MAREPKFRGTVEYSKRPIAGVTLYAEKKTEPSIEEMLDELEKSEVRAGRKDLILGKIRERIGTAANTKQATTTTSPNPKRYLVGPENGRIDINEEEGEYTYKDAMLISASIKGKGGHYDEAINLINAVKAFTQGGKSEEKPKEYYVEPNTGIIVHDPDNGEYTLSEARAISQSLQRGTGQGGEQTAGSFVDAEGEVHELKAGQPIVVKKVIREPAKMFILGSDGELEEHEPGKPVVIRVQSAPASNLPQMMPFPAVGTDGQPVYDKDGKPVFVNIDPMMRWLGFQSEERRADERQKAVVGLTQTIRENIPDGIKAILAAVSEVKGGTAAKTSKEKPQVFSCADCPTQFGLPPGWKGEPIKCPGCGRTYTKEELEK